MFEGRLKCLMVLLAAATLLVAGRLVQLQVFRADQYRQQTRRMLQRRPRTFPFVRGDVTDRVGVRLAYDAPAWDICVDYKIIARDAGHPDAPQPSPPMFAGSPLDHAPVPENIDPCWQAIADFSGTPVWELLDKARQIKRQVLRIRESVSRRLGVDTPVQEETVAHPLVRGLTQEQHVAGSLAFAAYDGVVIQASHARCYTGGPSVGHLLGRMAEVDADAIENDPQGEDELARYELGSMRGVSGVEALGESWLRGRRGRVHKDIDGTDITPPVEPQDGRTFRLSLDHALQQVMYNRLAAAVEATEFRTGGCAVMIHIPTRQVLAMVDYPSVDPNISGNEYVELLKDLKRRPLLFRAIREYYPPGSIVKPMMLAAALSDGLVGPNTQFTCYGRMFRDYPDRWRCTGMHGEIGPVRAIQKSCNSYFYHVGELLGVARGEHWMSAFGFGRVSGTGLVGEKAAPLPQGDMSKGLARSLAIGQRFDVTPIQAANMMACIASGAYRPVSLWLDDPNPPPAEPLAVREDAWRLVREGMYKVVNEQGGTAYGPDRGQLDDRDFVILGKTGSAEVARGRTIERLYTCHLPDGEVREISAPDKQAALAKLDLTPEELTRVNVTGGRSHVRYPPDPPEPYTHAWFAGYLAPRRGCLNSLGSGDLEVAIAVVIEYTGHGGEIASPVARDMVQSFLLRYRGGGPDAGGRP